MTAEDRHRHLMSQKSGGLVVERMLESHLLIMAPEMGRWHAAPRPDPGERLPEQPLGKVFIKCELDPILAAEHLD